MEEVHGWTLSEGRHTLAWKEATSGDRRGKLGEEDEGEEDGDLAKY